MEGYVVARRSIGLQMRRNDRDQRRPPPLGRSTHTSFVVARRHPLPSFRFEAVNERISRNQCAAT